jgi:hypothetical protein
VLGARGRLSPSFFAGSQFFSRKQIRKEYSPVRMNRMSLKFLSNDSSAELFESEFSCSLVGRTLRCARGRYAFTESLEGTFLWTAAVQSMSAVAIKAKIAGLTRTTPQAWPQEAGLCSDTTSWALSLDFALSKKPRWLLDMFGVDQSGAPIIKRLFIRMNPEKKRPGPAWVSINPAFLAPENVTIFLDGVEVTTASELSALLKGIGLGDQVPLKTKELPTVVEAAACDMYGTAQRLVEGWIEEEVRDSIFATDIFTSVSQKFLLSRIQADEPIRFLFGEQRNSFSDFFAPNLVLGIPTQDVARGLAERLGPVRLFATIAQVGAISLFKVMQKKLGLELEIVIDSPHTPALVALAKETAQSTRFVELFSLATGVCGSAVDLLRSFSILPITVLPGVSYDIMTNDRVETRGSLKGELYVFQESKSTSSIYLRHLHREGLIGTRALNLVKTEPTEALASMKLRGNRSGALLWFPHNRVSGLVANTTRALRLRDKFGLSESFLLGRMDDLTAINAIRDLVRFAWVQLRIDPILRRDVAHEISNSPDYFSALLKHTGMHSYLTEVPGLVHARPLAANS